MQLTRNLCGELYAESQVMTQEHSGMVKKN